MIKNNVYRTRKKRINTPEQTMSYILEIVFERIAKNERLFLPREKNQKSYIIPVEDVIHSNEPSSKQCPL